MLLSWLKGKNTIVHRCMNSGYFRLSVNCESQQYAGNKIFISRIVKLPRHSLLRRYSRILYGLVICIFSFKCFCIFLKCHLYLFVCGPVSSLIRSLDM